MGSRSSGLQLPLGSGLSLLEVLIQSSFLKNEYLKVLLFDVLLN